MNFVKYGGDLQKLLHKKAGMYIFSREQKDKTFKLGMSEKGLFKRLSQHKSCYPYTSEFWVQFIFLTDLEHVRPLEKSFLKETSHIKAIKVEQANLDDEEKKKAKEQKQRPREYRVFSTRTHLQSVVRSLLNTKDNRLLWSHCIVFSENSWDVIKNISATKAVNNPVDSVNTLAMKSKRIESRPPIEPVKALPYKESEVKINRVLKKGSKIATKWGKATVLRVISQEKVICKWADYDGEYELSIKTV